MARVSITMPDDLLVQARAAGPNVSRLAAAAIADALDRLAEIAELVAYLAELDAELCPPDAAEMEQARTWADQLDPPSPTPRQGCGRGVTLVLDSGGVNRLAG